MSTPPAVRAAFKEALIETIRDFCGQGVEKPDVHLVLLEISNLAVMPEPPWTVPAAAPAPEE
jgi:hypothetical protein